MSRRRRARLVDRPRLTLAIVADALRARGMTIRKRDGEYRVNHKGEGEGPAYYTDDLSDAYSTGLAMAKAMR